MDNKNKSFIKVFREMILMILKTSEKNSQEVLKMSSQLLGENTQKSLEDFYNLYFSQEKMADTNSEDINSEVDDLFEQAKASMEKGEEIDLETSQEDEQKRLGLSAIQKELEAVITVEKGLREKLVPVLSSMQFEDALRQRLQHVEEGLIKSIESEKKEDLEYESILNSLSSIDETKLFYTTALKKDPPDDLEAADTSIMFF